MTTTTIDFRTMPANVPSLCIPRVFPNINERRIRGVLDELSMGEIERIDIVRKQTEKGETFNRVFIHFKRWNTGGNADVARERLLNGKEIKIIYDDPWFWKISAARTSSEARPSARPAPRLQIDDDSTDRRPPRDNDHPRPNDRRPPRDSDRPRPNDRRPPRPNDRRDNDRRPRNRSPSPRRTGNTITERIERRNIQEEPRTPSCSPPREREAPPPTKKLNFKPKQIKEDVETGEEN